MEDYFLGASQAKAPSRVRRCYTGRRNSIVNPERHNAYLIIVDAKFGNDFGLHLLSMDENTSGQAILHFHCKTV
jgi:hypothetical protein